MSTLPILCPYCQTEVTPDPENPAAAPGLLLCSHCGLEFQPPHVPLQAAGEATVRAQQARLELDDPEAGEAGTIGSAPAVEASAAAPVEPDPAAEPVPEHVQDDLAAAAAAAAESTDAPAAAVEPDPVLDDAAPVEQAQVMYIPAAAAPSFARPQASTPPPSERRRARWHPVLIAALVLLLAGQCIVAERVRLAADAQWRPWLSGACSVLGCELPDWHDPTALRILTRDVRPHPSVAGALLISASFRNEAPWPQRWPPLDLTLSDLDGRAVGQRRFTADQYLGFSASDELIQPGQTASITLEVRDPGKQAVAFEFELL